MGFLDKAKAAAEQAAAKAKEGVEDVQVKRELGQAYGELGKKTFDAGRERRASRIPSSTRSSQRSVVSTRRQAGDDDGAAPSGRRREPPRNADEPPATSA